MVLKALYLIGFPKCSLLPCPLPIATTASVDTSTGQILAVGLHNKAPSLQMVIQKFDAGLIDSLEIFDAFPVGRLTF